VSAFAPRSGEKVALSEANGPDEILR
jgi:hypothetical protein